MSLYFIRNVDSGKWLKTKNGFETSIVEDSSCRYWSERAAKAVIREILADRKKYNYPEINYEVVAFRLVEVGVV
jgi:Zn-finger protein